MNVLLLICSKIKKLIKPNARGKLDIKKCNSSSILGKRHFLIQLGGQNTHISSKMLLRKIFPIRKSMYDVTVISLY